MRIFHGLICLFVCLSLVGCEAPRTNPYDPESSTYIGSNAPTATFYGTVQTRNLQPIQDAFIYIPGVAAVSSDSSGQFEITNLPSGKYQVICTKEGFTTSTVTDSLGFLQVKRVDFELNSVPQLLDFDITTHYVYNVPFTPSIYYELRANAIIFDPDGAVDIDTVLFTTTDSLFLYAFKEADVVNDTAIYTLTAREDTIPGLSIYSLVDKEFFCQVWDKNGAQNTSQIQLITRVFDKYPQPDYPLGGLPYPKDTLEVVWYEFEETFNFTFTVSLYYGSTPDSFWDSTGISSEVTSIVIGDFLVFGTYHWRIEAVDFYGNSALSSKSYFVIQ
ncbi:carboxypeptidase-like regulatory domain-containing protein [bacterium]|nr:carboxypeptidase-like regulatory domain-containing protein [bacterium]MBU1652784.1 carboxypeptidase-like regulatory domain-containing protein [bacterium]MBU1882006.1 carboxypeptidase-like regulatory domain-containing protein [bacterium]